MKKYAIALLGAGRIGVGHAKCFANNPAVDLIICDVNMERAQEVADMVGGRAMELDAVFAPGSGVDGVAIATATTTHPELIKRAAEAGLPFFCEKPVALSLEETLEAVAAVKKAGVAAQIGFDRRFDLAYNEAKRALQAGEIGELHRLHMLTCDPAPPPESFVSGSGGIIRDCLIHDFDILRWTTGLEVEEVYAMGSVRGADYFAKYDDHDEVVITLRMSDGTLATAHTSRNNGAGYDVRMELAGTKGNRTVGLEDRVPLTSAEPGCEWPPGPAWYDFLERFEPCFQRELDAFVQVVAGEIESPCPIEEALESLRIALAAMKSMEENRPVKLSEIPSV